MKTLKQKLDEAEHWFEENTECGTKQWDKLFSKFLEMLNQYVSELEKKYEEKSDEEIKKILVQAEDWFDKNPNHPKFNDVFKEYRATLRVYGKRRSMGKGHQKSLFDL